MEKIHFSKRRHDRKLSLQAEILTSPSMYKSNNNISVSGNLFHFYSSILEAEDLREGLNTLSLCMIVSNI